MNESELFDQNPEVVSGALVFKGTRVPVDVLFESLLGGSTLDEILEDFPSIGRDRAEAAIRLAQQSLHRDAA
ncbi:DUF433 domain-containing protein [Antarcticirhabdus aurantiaca]|uniref:DUF433 domain-containing protein n=1 Tax=Antarcticirhabdus aurantiaca TaxID=2606717 RepID=A0ACD4NL13_9HYPH|nr:DUF433 domain-containing protein [Antarcticirhabdus aurantiaca]WAJ27610.1 DUF433 domain-containing protein [Jeongeuplla avenae]